MEIKLDLMSLGGGKINTKFESALAELMAILQPKEEGTITIKVKVEMGERVSLAGGGEQPINANIEATFEVKTPKRGTKQIATIRVDPSSGGQICFFVPESNEDGRKHLAAAGR